MKRLITQKEAAEYLGISTKTLWEWSKQGLIPMIKIKGRRIKYDLRELDLLIDTNKIVETSCKDNLPTGEFSWHQFKKSENITN